MRHHVVLCGPVDADEIDRRVADGTGPRHVLLDLARRLDATLHQPEPVDPGWMDRIGAGLIGQPRHWALARRLVGTLGRDDIVYCAGEDVGLPLATLAERAGVPARIIVFIHSIDRPRGRLALSALPAARSVRLFVTNCTPQVDYLRDRAGVSTDRLWLLLEQTDTGFFSPGPSTGGRGRPTVVSVGLERRDYRTLAAATQDMDVDVRISAFSADVQALARSLPPRMPANMDRRYYPWPALRQLYRDADVIVVPVLPGVATAGVTSLLEAMASGRPVIVTRSPGLADYLVHEDALSIVPPEDPAALRGAITALLSDPAAAERQAARALAVARRLYGAQGYVQALLERIEGLRRGTAGG